MVATQSAGGTKTNTPIVETPQSISVVTRTQLDEQAVKNVSQALNYTSGVYAEPRGSVNGLYEFPNIRGFNINGFLYQDGMQLLGASGGLQVDPYGLERIEVVKGPSSVLYGAGSPSGIVNLVSKRPTDVPFNEIQIQGGSFDRKQVSVDSSGKLDKNGEFLYRFTGVARDSDTQVDFTKDNRVFVAPAITWRPTKDTTWTVLVNYLKADSGFFNFLPSVGTFRPNPFGQISTSFYAGDPNFNKSTIENASVTSLFEHSFNDAVTFRSNYRHAELSIDQQLLTTTFFTGNRTLLRNTFKNNDSFSNDTTDNQLQFKFNTGGLQHTVLTGVDYARSYEDHKTWNGPAPSIDVFNPVYGVAIAQPTNNNLNANQTTEQTGLYAQHQGKWGGLNTQLGIRWDDATTSTFNGPTTAAPATSSTSKLHDNATSKRAGALYLFDSGIAPYVNYSESFAPTPNLLTLANQPLKPSTGQQYEAGLKYQPPGYSALFTVAVFDLKRQNVAVPDPASVLPTISYYQIGETRSRGLEVEGRFSLTKSLDVVGAYTYLDTKITNSNNLTEFANKTPVGVPRNNASLWADYTFRSGPLSGFGAAVGVRYIGESFADVSNTVSVPSYTLTDAAIHYELGDLNPQWKGAKLQLNATNVFDRTYVSSCVGALSLLGGTEYQCFYGLRRSVIGTLSYRW